MEQRSSRALLQGRCRMSHTPEHADVLTKTISIYFLKKVPKENPDLEGHGDLVKRLVLGKTSVTTWVIGVTDVLPKSR